MRSTLFLVWLWFASITSSEAFLMRSTTLLQGAKHRHTLKRALSFADDTFTDTDENSVSVSVPAPHNMPPRLFELCEQFRYVPDAKLRYEELLFMGKEAPPLEAAHKIPSNKVPGCQSTIYMHCTIDEQRNLHFAADSDSVLTRGLAAFLVQGLSGYSLQTILAVEPEFIRYAGLSESLTTSRSNGFLSMFNTMKKKALEVSGCLS